ncbi:MAG TPA: hypothetical protein VK468_05360, partial [Pyrinomonadaceae bacterium]|nr:hypothetical protein [Pyrinomonadaceae bacterium]
LFNWWKTQNTKHRNLWPGLATYRIGSTPTFTAGEIGDQIELTRRSAETSGAVHFSFRSLRSDMGGIQKALTASIYQRDAITPAFGWIRARRPLAPKVSITRDAGYVRASWAERGTPEAFWFVVYAKDKDGWTYSIVPSATRSITLSADRKIEKIVVTSVDRLGSESR